MSIPAPFTDQEIADQITRGGNWWYGNNGDMVINYSFSSDLGSVWGNTGEYVLDATQQAWIQTALNSISDIFGFTFNEISQPNNSSVNNAFDIIQFVNDTNTGTYSSNFAYTSGPNADGHVASAVVFDQTWNSNQSANLEYGSYGYMTMLHEILHSLGMEHPGDYNAGSGSGPITYQDNAEFEQDTHRYTVMSYFDAYEDGSGSVFYDLVNNKFVYPRTLMVYDILAMSSGDYDGNFGGYGFNSTTRNTDTVYGYNATSGIDAAYDFDAHGAPVLTLYDTGGIDTLDLSGDTVSQEIIVTYDAEGVPTGYIEQARTSTLIDLREGGYSSTHGMKYNIGIAFGTEIENAIGTMFNDTIYGNDLANMLDGGEGDDTLYGGDGDDTLIGGLGADILDGGANTAVGDTVSYADATSAVYISIGGSAGRSGFYSEGDRLYNIENLIGSDYDDTLIGSSDDNVLDGGSGDDLLIGRGGADVINGGSNGAGGDTASYSTSGAAVFVDLGADTASGGDAEGDELNDIENLFGSQHADTLTGDGNANTLQGFGGADTLSGAGGDDTLEGMNGNDTLNGGTGADYLNGGGGIDTADYSTSTTGVDARIGRTGSGGDAEGDFLYSIENIIGSDYNDYLVGTNTANVLTGGGGDDTLLGGNNTDTLYGGDGDDTLVGGNGGDIIDGGDGDGDVASYFSSVGGVRVDLLNGTATAGQATGDTLTGIENLYGSNGGADRLYGDNSANVLRGYAGADWLKGNGGDDTLSGGNDSDIDRFIYDAENFGKDTITDFGNAEDILDMRGLGLTIADVIATQVGTSTVLTFNGLNDGEQITLRNFNAADIDSSDFFF